MDGYAGSGSRLDEFRWFRWVLAAVAWVLLTSPLGAQEAEWIWSPDHEKDQVPVGATCHFRKTFVVRSASEATLTLAADDTYELFLNGRRIGQGRGYRKLDQYDLTRLLSRGQNTIALRVVNETGNTAALVARLLVHESDGGWKSYSSDESWVTALNPLPLWNTQIYSDNRWPAARVYGTLGDTAPWDRAEQVAREQSDQGERFAVVEGFEVQRVMDGQVTGSLIAMTFNEFGSMLVSREGGPLLRIDDSDGDQIPDMVKVYCDQVNSCQGILALNGEVFVTADGPEGTALYRLTDADRDGKLEQVRALVKFNCENPEHGPHGVTLGPDGLLYVAVGNHATLTGEAEFRSPYRNAYEGDLVPRYEDPGGHAAGVKAPGGTVLRTDIEGSSVELVAGGIRNSYDLVFNEDSELFLHDSDMESDLGMTWYRPTQVFHVTPGAELGWRSGWAKWADYLIDVVPPLADTGRGSPTGAVVYDHFMFPRRYHQALFLADWSEGRILAVRLKRQGASYSASSEVFLQGQPLNVTDLEIGPDGWLYYVTGGRGTSGGIYRVTWKGTVPDSMKDLGEGITAVIRQPQLQTAWSRQRIARLRAELGDRWPQLVEGVARATQNPVEYRIRALDVMQLYGPLPSAQLLIDLSEDPNERLRAKAAYLMGLHADQQTHERLLELLEDSDRTVRRVACESLARAGQDAPLQQLVSLLESDDRHESFAARRLLERIPLDSWRDEVLTHDNLRVFLQGSLALVIADPDPENARDVLQRCADLMTQFISDRDFIDMLRLMQVAIQRGELPPDELTGLREALAAEFPSGHAQMNRELMRLLAYLQAETIQPRLVNYLNANIDEAEKIHAAMLARFLSGGWTPEQRLELLQFFERSQKRDGGASYTLYVLHATRDFARMMDAETARETIALGHEMPNAALGALYTLPPQLDDDTRGKLIQLDKRIRADDSESAQRLKVGIIAVLARSGDADSMEHLREIWLEEPERRATAAMGLAQAPEGENWSLLVRSLPILDGPQAREVLRKLKTVPLAPEEGEFYRQVILCGLRLADEGATDALELLNFWTGADVAAPGANWQDAIASWQTWFRREYPDLGDASLPEAPENSKWQFPELLEYLTGKDAAQGSITRGAEVYAKAQCIKCHRFGSKGEPLGPDLTSIAKRFTKREILESVLFPSHVISSQYAAKTVLLVDGRTFSGIVAPGAAGETVVLQSTGEKISVATEDIDEIVASPKSAMPDQLLDTLTLEEISDLFAYLTNPPATGVTRRE